MNHKKMWIFVLIGIVLAVLVLFWVWMRQSAGEELVLDEMSTEQISTADVEGELVPEELGKTNIGKTIERTEEIGGVNSTGEIDFSGTVSEIPAAYEEHRVVCDVETEAQARTVADQIGGKLISFQYGIGTIEIEETVDELMERLGKMKNAPEVYRCFNESLIETE